MKIAGAWYITHLKCLFKIYGVLYITRLNFRRVLWRAMYKHIPI